MTATEERIRIDIGHGSVSGAFAGPKAPVAALVVGHGAGGGMDSPFLTGFTRAMNEGGIATLRFSFPYAERGRRAPDPEATLRRTWIAAFREAVRRAARAPVLAGGKSLGGRIASMCVADGDVDARGLVFLGYPLHAPGKPDRIRDEHLYRIEVPMLFLHGTRDPFARADLLAPVLQRLGPRAEYVAIDGGDHSFRVRGVRRDDRATGASLADPASAFVRRIAAG
jgi:predicted alpha/beta-hydrolase family hydrolase